MGRVIFEQRFKKMRKIMQIFGCWDMFPAEERPNAKPLKWESF